MKKFFGYLVVICLCGIVYTNRETIINFFSLFFYGNETAIFGEPNEYYKNSSYKFVQDTDNLYPNNKQDVLNIIYSTLNRGVDNVTFYCGDNYSSCIDDVNEIADNSLYLSTINNLVHPFNSYKNIHFSISNYGKVSIEVEKVYSEEKIALINNRIDEIMGSLINDSMADYDKILAFHDYIVNNTYYDSSVGDTGQVPEGNNSNTAYGLLFEGKAICSGYSDSMAIFLSKLGIDNYKISSDIHIWNLVNLNGVWKHIDTTWDDPVTASGQNLLLHDFFMINSYDLAQKEQEYEMHNHDYNQDLYVEANIWEN